MAILDKKNSLIEINKSHTDEHQKWVKDPNITKRPRPIIGNKLI